MHNIELPSSVSILRKTVSKLEHYAPKYLTFDLILNYFSSGAWPMYAKQLSAQQPSQNFTRLKLNLFSVKR